MSQLQEEEQFERQMKYQPDSFGRVAADAVEIRDGRKLQISTELFALNAVAAAENFYQLKGAGSHDLDFLTAAINAAHEILKDRHQRDGAGGARV